MFLTSALMFVQCIVLSLHALATNLLNYMIFLFMKITHLHLMRFILCCLSSVSTIADAILFCMRSDGARLFCTEWCLATRCANWLPDNSSWAESYHIPLDSNNRLAFRSTAREIFVKLVSAIGHRCRALTSSSVHATNRRTCTCSDHSMCRHLMLCFCANGTITIAPNVLSP